MVVLGSGGHTTEMIRLISDVKKLFGTRIYVAAEERSKLKVSRKMAYIFYAVNLQALEAEGEGMKNVHIHQITRSRGVGQSYITSIATTLLASVDSAFLFFKTRSADWYCYLITNADITDRICCLLMGLELAFQSALLLLFTMQSQHTIVILYM